MGKNDFLTPKAIGNRIKAKGLQKLRWYCQLCQKQCRDENGFKCHQMSDSHRRQMEVFGQNPGRVIHGYSEEFERDFLAHLKQAHPFSRVSAKVVYNEYIQDKHHVHMNSTRWLTLTEFVKYLGREGKCKVDETPKGWFVTLIQKDAQEVIDEEKRLKRAAAEKEEEERHLAAMQEQVERARKQARTIEDGDVAHEFTRDEDTGPLVLGLARGTAAGTSGRQGDAAGGGASTSAAAAAAALPPRPQPSRPVQASSVFGDDEEDVGPSGGKASSSAPEGKRLSKVEELMKKELEAQAAAQGSRAPRKLDYWLATGIIVKVMSKELAEHGYYKQKGLVQRVIDRYVGEISMLDSGDVVRVDQEQLETVIPSPGGTVLAVNGPHRGSKATLLQIDTDRFQAQVRLLDGPSKGKEFWMEYEDVCKWGG